MWKSDLGCNSKWAFGGLTEVSCWVEAKTRRTTTTHQQSASACLQGNNNQSLRLLRNPTRKRWTIWQHGCTYIGRLMSISPLCKVISASTTLSKQQTPQHLRWKTSKWPLTSEKCTLHSVHSVQCTHMFVHKFDHLWDKKLAIPSRRFMISYIQNINLVFSWKFVNKIGNIMYFIVKKFCHRGRTLKNSFKTK